MPSLRLALVEEKSEWKGYREHLDRSKRKDFDMFAIPQLYVSAYSAAVVSVVWVHPIFISITFHHYKELMEIASQIGGVVREQI